MFNNTKIKQLIKKNTRINGMALPRAEDSPATEILFTIEGYVAFRISSYDTDIIAKLIEVKAMDLDYSFQNKTDLTSLFTITDQVPYALTPVTITDDKKQIAILQSKDHVAYISKKYADCFKTDAFHGLEKTHSPMYYVEGGRVKGLIIPWNIDTIDVLQELATKTTPTVVIKTRDSDPNFGYCSHCSRAERLRTWQDYKHCPVCGYRITRGGR